ncbi:MAG: hypothetical protein K2O00_00315 [Muribaculaceae bacterium]|nr:hypothetical protein [Muribaculaceae bacterium]
MKRHIILLSLALIFLVPLRVNAIKIKLKKDPGSVIDYGAWVSSSSLPSEVEGIKQFYPESRPVVDDDGNIVDTIAVIKDCCKVNDMRDTQIFLAAMVYASNNFERKENAKEGFESIDYDNNNFVMIFKRTQGTTSNETTYTCNIKISADDGSLCFEIFDIDCRFREKGLIPRTIPLEKLHPDRNKRHEELVKELVKVSSGYISDMMDYVNTRKDIVSPNYNLLKKKSDVAVGMNEDEVTILLGPPMNKRKSGERVRWIYANDYVIIFTDGIVSKIVD